MSKSDDMQKELKPSGADSSVASVIDFRGGVAHEDSSLQNHLQSSAPSSRKRSTPGSFSLIYESRDGRLCMFEDQHGHLTCVRSDRFA